MTKLYFVCALTLLAVLMDFLFLRSASVKAQRSSGLVAIDRITDLPRGTSLLDTKLHTVVRSQVVGFSCVMQDQEPVCFVASIDR